MDRLGLSLELQRPHLVLLPIAGGRVASSPGAGFAARLVKRRLPLPLVLPPTSLVSTCWSRWGAIPLGRWYESCSATS